MAPPNPIRGALLELPDKTCQPETSRMPTCMQVFNAITNSSATYIAPTNISVMNDVLAIVTVPLIVFGRF
jgi:hypothetical protein